MYNKWFKCIDGAFYYSFFTFNQVQVLFPHPSLPGNIRKRCLFVYVEFYSIVQGDVE
jgi:hypothetical protein